MGTEYERNIETAITSTATQGDPKTLYIKAGAPLDMFAASSWPASFVEFFYGDCAPNLDRPRKVSWRELFNYLMSREELEYCLPGDTANPDIPGGCYRAPGQSRWNTPEFAAMFADTIRKIAILQTTKAVFLRDGHKWKSDMKLIAEATTSDFEALQHLMARHGHRSLSELASLASEHNLMPLHAALKHLTLQTSSIPLTQGYKSSLRQLGFSLNVYDGPLTVFLTTNFADTYSPITITLMNGAGEPLGHRVVNLLEDIPDMPTLQAMHRALAKHPMIQADLFLLLDSFVHTELLCMTAFCGKKAYDNWKARAPPKDDDFASTGEPGIANFPRSALKPLEAQGRGFTHGHEKIISVPQTRAARLKKVFTTAASTESSENELNAWCRRAREAVLQAASTLQYDSAIKSGTQLGVTLPPEPFTARQQNLSKFDGGEEALDEQHLRRPLIPLSLIHI